MADDDDDDDKIIINHNSTQMPANFCWCVFHCERGSLLVSLLLLVEIVGNVVA